MYIDSMTMAIYREKMTAKFFRILHECTLVIVHVNE